MKPATRLGTISALEGCLGPNCSTAVYTRSRAGSLEVREQQESRALCKALDVEPVGPTLRRVVKGRTRKSPLYTKHVLTCSWGWFGELVDPCPSICAVERVLLCHRCGLYNVPNRAIVCITWLAEEKSHAFLVVVQDRILRAC